MLEICIFVLGMGDCRDCSTQARPRSSKLTEIGCRTSGSPANSLTSGLSATVNRITAAENRPAARIKRVLMLKLGSV